MEIMEGSREKTEQGGEARERVEAVDLGVVC